MIAAENLSLSPLTEIAASHGRDLGVGLEPGSVVAWADQIRPILIAALARSRPNDVLLVVTPTDTQARVLFDDLRAYADCEVDFFPSWETLPFERVSPATETMGERMRLVARLRRASPRLIVAPIRAVLQRLSPASHTFEPLVIRRGSSLDLEAVTNTLVEWGYVREQLAEHRGEFARRGAILDVFGSTDDSPVRIELWGDDVERLSAFSVNDQLSIAELDEMVIYPARELLVDDAVAARAQELASQEPWGREQWERVAQRTGFDGMENWLAWLVPDVTTLIDVLPRGSRLVVCDPAYLRSRAKELHREERAVAEALASTWSFQVSDALPRLHVEVDDLLKDTSVEVLLSVASPGLGDPSDGAISVAAGRWGSAVTTNDQLAERMREYLQLDYRIVLACDSPESAARFRNDLSALAVPSVLHAEVGADFAAGAVHVVVR
ncbi:MAG: transcription-repair-coupling factor, partial [Actinomycetota bacterium]